jgi:hypothetical protein
VSNSGANYDDSQIYVESFRIPTDADDTPAWRRAVAKAIAAGIPKVMALRKSYSLSSGIDMNGASGLTIDGGGVGNTILNFISSTGTDIPAGFYNTGTVSDLLFDNFTIRGTIIDDVTTPRRSRTSTAPGVASGFIFKGDLNPGNGATWTATNITLGNINIEKTSGLPFQFDGIRGYARALTVNTYLTMDGGWVFCEHVVGEILRSIKSADNGYSISRSNQKVTIGSIYAELCAYYGAWFAGFAITGTDQAENGPQNFTVESVHVENAGMGGLNMDNAPKNGKIVSVYVDGVSRGPSDGVTDAGGLGVLIGGYPSTNRGSITSYAENIFIENVVALNCTRGAVYISGGVRNVWLDTVNSLNSGSQYLADGTTAIANTDIESNNAVNITGTYGSSVSNIRIGTINNADTRGTPYANYAIAYPATATNITYISAVSNAARQAVPSSRQASIAIGGQTVSATAGGNGAYRKRGTVNATAVAAPVAGTIAIVTYPAAYAVTPSVNIQPTNLASYQAGLYVSSRGTTTFTVSSAVAAAANASLSFDYTVDP